MFVYNKLFALLALRGMKKTDLLTVAHLTPSTLAKLSKGATLSTAMLERICSALQCQPGDIMEYKEADR